MFLGFLSKLPGGRTITTNLPGYQLLYKSTRVSPYLQPGFIKTARMNLLNLQIYPDIFLYTKHYISEDTNPSECYQRPCFLPSLPLSQLRLPPLLTHVPHDNCLRNGLAFHRGHNAPVSALCLPFAYSASEPEVPIHCPGISAFLDDFHV